MIDLPQATRVFIDPISHSEYVSQIYAGLFDLEAAGALALEFTRQPAVKVVERDHDFYFSDNQHVFYLEAEIPGNRRFTMCFDMHDSPRATSWNGLLECDVYVKRSYNRPFLEEYLASRGQDHLGLMPKIIPYGFNYYLISPNERARFRRLLAHRIRYGLIREQPKLTLKQIVREGLHTIMPSRPSVLNESRRLEVPASRPAAPRVLLQTRLMDPAMAQSESGAALISELNDTRVRYVRSLKEALGDRFVGGIIPEGYAKHYPSELMTREPYGRSDYLDLVQANQVVIYTLGRAKSNGWRLGEYLAMSRCLVSVPLHYEVPVPLEEGRNALFFETENGCVAACKRLIEDQELAQAMREANETYYKEQVKPAAIVRNALLNGAKIAG